MRILFVCTGNTCRSPMAEALMEQMGKEKGFKNLSVDSAGIFAVPDAPISQNAKEVLEKHFSIKHFSHFAKPLTKELLKKADLVVTATEDHRRLLIQKFGCEEKTVSFPVDISDPYGGFLETYKHSADAIKQGLERLIEAGKIHD